MENYCILPKTSDQSLLAKYYSLANIFTICSTRENFPTTCVEAQCCGTAIVGFDSGGTKETSVTFKEDFVPFGRIEDLRDKVKEGFIKNPNRNDIAKKAQLEYSKEVMASKYFHEYDRYGHRSRILLIDVNCKYSSTGKICYDLYTEIRKNGREAAICYGRGPVVEGENIYKFGLDWETKIHAAISRITGYNGYFSPFSTKRAIDFIEKFKPDLIHIHELHAYFVNLKPLLIYIKQKKIPIIWTFHCEYMYTGKCGYAMECTNFQRGCGSCPHIHGYPKSIFFDVTKQMFKMKQQLLKDMDLTIITPSKWLSDRVKLSFLKDKRIKVIHNGIDTQIFHPVDSHALRAKLGIPKDYKIVLSVAPDIMSERKGGKWVLRLAEIMKNEKVYFVLVGGG